MLPGNEKKGVGWFSGYFSTNKHSCGDKTSQASRSAAYPEALPSTSAGESCSDPPSSQASRMFWEKVPETSEGASLFLCGGSLWEPTPAFWVSGEQAFACRSHPDPANVLKTQVRISLQEGPCFFSLSSVSSLCLQHLRNRTCVLLSGSDINLDSRLIVFPLLSFSLEDFAVPQIPSM